MVVRWEGTERGGGLVNIRGAALSFDFLKMHQNVGAVISFNSWFTNEMLIAPQSNSIISKTWKNQ